MILDNELQRRLLLDLIQHSSLTGAVLDEAYSLKRAITVALVESHDEASGNGLDHAASPLLPTGLRRYTPEELAEASTDRVPSY